MAPMINDSGMVIDLSLMKAITIDPTRPTVRAYAHLAAEAPDELSTEGQLMYAPPAPFIPEAYQGRLKLHMS